MPFLDLLRLLDPYLYLSDHRSPPSDAGFSFGTVYAGSAACEQEH